jgi:hypothetical protein
MFRVRQRADGIDDADTIEGAREVVREQPLGRCDVDEIRADPLVANEPAVGAVEPRRDCELIGRLEAIRGAHLDPKRSDAENASAFRDFGVDPDQLDPKEAGQRI